MAPTRHCRPLISHKIKWTQCGATSVFLQNTSAPHRGLNDFCCLASQYLLNKTLDQVSRLTQKHVTGSK
jgi:hypothetical protein